MWIGCIIAIYIHPTYLITYILTSWPAHPNHMNHDSRVSSLEVPEALEFRPSIFQLHNSTATLARSSAAPQSLTRCGVALKLQMAEACNDNHPSSHSEHQDVLPFSHFRYSRYPGGSGASTVALKACLETCNCGVASQRWDEGNEGYIEAGCRQVDFLSLSYHKNFLYSEYSNCRYSNCRCLCKHCLQAP